MENQITVTLTQKEANAVFSILAGTIDEFTACMKEAGKQGSAERVLQYAEKIELMKDVQKKLMDKGAVLWH